LNNKIKELQLNEINLQSQISILEATNESKAEKITSILNDLSKLKEEVNNTMVSKIYFNQMESKYRDETVPLEIYTELKSNLDALSSEIEENFIDRDEYLQLEDKLNKTLIEKFLVEESVTILTTDKHNLSKLILDQKHMIDSLNETINTKNSEISQHVEGKSSLENYILEIKHSLDLVSGDQDPVKVQLREEIDSVSYYSVLYFDIVLTIFWKHFFISVIYLLRIYSGIF
jgi:chromosome segregation ATPase